MTKKGLITTSFITRISDSWSFKYYRYDERGRVIKMWNIIDGLPVKEIRYQYNSQDQITQTNYGYNSEFKRYSYYYDYTGRLYTLNYANTDPALDKSAIDYNFTTYSYNPNSLISFQFFKQSQFQNQYEYNDRNWITSMNSLQGLFGFTNTYFPNGNVNTQLLFGTYKDQYPENNYNLNYRYTYDNSNRLLEAVNTNQGDLSYSVFNTYDKDGNITTLKRYGDNNNLTDNFNYQYYTGTNKLSKVSGAIDQYSYDLNGNVTRDTINYNYNIQYDHRNLITQFYHTDREAVSRPYTYATRYYYDESGSRVRKLEYLNTQTNPPLITDWDNPGNGWQLYNNEFYVKGVDGKDLATYKGNILDEWFVWGNDIVGKIKNDKAYYFYKDHLGSVRAIVNENASIVAAYDYDVWGYPLEGRTYNADTIKFKYTGKELDKESLYDYFGARYYDSRIGRWGQVEPLLEKYLSISPYSYAICNPLKYNDINGKDAIFSIDKKNKKINIEIIFNYSIRNKNNKKNNPLGISGKQFSVLKELGKNIEDLWTGPFEINGKEYQVTTNVSYKSFDTFNLALAASQDNEGQNTVKNAQIGDYIEGTIGTGTVGAVLFLANGKKLNPRWDTGAHEAGHLLGLPDIDDNSIMSYAVDRRNPGDEDMGTIFHKNNLNISIFGEQKVKGNVP